MHDQQNIYKKIIVFVSFPYDTWCYISVYRLRSNMVNTLFKSDNFASFYYGLDRPVIESRWR